MLRNEVESTIMEREQRLITYLDRVQLESTAYRVVPGSDADPQLRPPPAGVVGVPAEDNRRGMAHERAGT